MTFKEWWGSLPIMQQLCHVDVARRIWETAALAERERCAKVCDKLWDDMPDELSDDQAFKCDAYSECAEAIRRGE